jgi:hypothetical protein
MKSNSRGEADMDIKNDRSSWVIGGTTMNGMKNVTGIILSQRRKAR